MKTTLLTGFLVLCCTALPCFAGEFKIGSHTFTVPEGFTVERIAGPPLVDRPIVADFDERGRLYVADSSGSNEPVKKQLEQLPHRIVRLEDTNGDGIFDQSTVFADKMMFPEGTMWFDGSLYVSAPPSIWKLTDTTGDGVADQREEWFKGTTLTGCANDLHGPYLGPDGWIYWAKGAFAKQTYEYPGRKPFVTRAAHIFRTPPSGGPIEPVMTGGMDNPIDVVFTPEGERIFTTTFFQHPQGGRRDGLIHAIYGGVYGKVHDVIDEHPRTGDVLPVLTHMGAAAPSGLVRYSSRAFGDEYQNNLFTALFNMRKVTRHVLQPIGATYKTVDSDFLVSDDPDFHPTDVLEDADGSLIVVDTGGWYKLCCPTSQLAKPDVLGAIYRVRRIGAPKIEDPRGTKMNWGQFAPADLASLLGDKETRPAVRERAIQELARRGTEAVSVLEQTVKTSGSLEARRDAVWTLTRIDAPEARAAVRAALADEDQSVRHAAIHSTALWRDGEALPALLPFLRAGTPPLQRVAAEAVGRIGDKAAVTSLLEASRGVTDRILEHAFTYALIEIADPEGTAAGLAADDPHTRRTALIALDQMPGGGLAPEQILPLLTGAEPLLKETGQWIAGRHPEWGEAMAGFFRDRLAANLSGNEAGELQRQLNRFGRNAAIQALLASAANDSTLGINARITALRAMARSGVSELPEAWQTELGRALGAGDSAIVIQAVATLRSLPASKKNPSALAPALRRVAAGAQFPAETRLDALAAIPGSITELDSALFDFLVSNITSDKPVPTRSAASTVLARARLSEDQLRALIAGLASVGPMELPRLLQPFEHGSSESLGVELLAALAKAPAASVLREELLKPRLKNFPPSVQAKADELLTFLHEDLPKQRAHLDELLAKLAHEQGDIRRGQAIFNSPQTACSACHALGYAGGNLGPDLTNIGTIRTERDLLEAIIYPSASFVRSYESISVTTKDEHYTGVLRQDGIEEVVLAIGPDAEVRIARSNIVEMMPGSVSIMPGGLHEQLSLRELADLLTFLKNTRRGAQ
jgi:putative membrane-bound dehydrogenase-like protein